MEEDDFVGGSASLVEVVHVKLAHKRVGVAVLEVCRQDYLLELILVYHFKVHAVVTPADDFGMLFLTANLKKLEQERAHACADPGLLARLRLRFQLLVV